MTTFSLLNFGCRASQADGAALKRQLIESGLTEAPDCADVAILNTCTVTAAADAEIRQTIRRIHRENSRCKILVTGCYAQRAPKEIAAIEGVAWVIGNSHKHSIPEILQKAVPQKVDFKGQGNDVAIRVGEIAAQFHFLPVFPDDRTRPTLKIQDGCNARCSFCIIPAVRGRSRSLPPSRVIEQIRLLENGGYCEVVLSGINLGGYGRDLDRSVTFLGLLERILVETAIRRIRISSIEPMDVHPALIRLVATEPRLADHFHVPLQSGSDRILRQMNRRYWTAQYAERILAIRESLPHCGIGADVMTGFPGETERNHEESSRFIDSLPFTYLHIFPYSSRPSTPAAARADQVNGRIAHERGAALRALIARKRQSFLAAQVGRTLSAVTLSDAKKGDAAALSSNFLNLSLPECRVGPNQMVNIGVQRAHEGRLYGYVDEHVDGGQRERLPFNLAGISADEISKNGAGHRPGNLPE
ncbi:MAG TPA: tRNA (N(6)-L-threonylcarbamoyladenosine(37)-C(2))-methylthiotransferase MtaB [Terriglobia bacterium]|nr:tRNA (N(6)-L-threonylcarbamoyladenosine(37)-C(2))-methylthiotransferase MtaB [Terriglobia bacterium]